MLLQTVAATGGWNGVASFTKQVKNSYQSVKFLSISKIYCNPTFKALQTLGEEKMLSQRNQL